MVTHSVDVRPSAVSQIPDYFWLVALSGVEFQLGVVLRNAVAARNRLVAQPARDTVAAPKGAMGDQVCLCLLDHAVVSVQHAPISLDCSGIVKPTLSRALR